MRNNVILHSVVSGDFYLIDSQKREAIWLFVSTTIVSYRELFRIAFLVLVLMVAVKAGEIIKA